MAKYIVKRVAMGIFSVFIVATLTFFIMNLVPGGPFVAEKSISKAAQQALAEKYGLDKPLGVQYLNYMNSLDPRRYGPEPETARPYRQPDHLLQAACVSARTAGLAVVWSPCASAFRWAVCLRITEENGLTTLLLSSPPAASLSRALFPASCCFTPSA